MSSPKVTVIVAAYNAEKYIERCLNSIAAQTLTDWEAIVVDDGSRDRTGRIADSFSEKDGRFRVIHQENKGVAAARQTGLDAARGEYTIHVDSDDWVEPCMLERIVSCAQLNHADMVVFDFVVHLSNGTTEYWKQNTSGLDHWTVFGLTLHNLHGSLCNKLIRREIIKANGIRFAKDLFACEDMYFVLSLMAKQISISYINEAFYHYDRRQNTNSLVNGNPLIIERLTVLEMIDKDMDLSYVQHYFDSAIFHLAYDAVRLPASACPNYPRLFKKHIRSIRMAKGFPLRAKVVVLLGLLGIRVPVEDIKRL